MVLCILVHQEPTKMNLVSPLVKNVLRGIFVMLHHHQLYHMKIISVRLASIVLLEQNLQLNIPVNLEHLMNCMVKTHQFHVYHVEEDLPAIPRVLLFQQNHVQQVTIVRVGLQVQHLPTIFLISLGSVLGDISALSRQLTTCLTLVL